MDDECEVQYTDLLSLMAICERKQVHNDGLDSALVIDENLWNPRRLGVSSVNKTAQAVVLPSIKGKNHPLREKHTKFPGFNR